MYNIEITYHSCRDGEFTFKMYANLICIPKEVLLNNGENLDFNHTTRIFMKDKSSVFTNRYSMTVDGMAQMENEIRAIIREAKSFIDARREMGKIRLMNKSITY